MPDNLAYQHYQENIQSQIKQALLKVAEIKKREVQNNETSTQLILKKSIDEALKDILPEASAKLVHPPKKIGSDNGPDYALAMFEAAKSAGQDPAKLAEEAASKLGGLEPIEKASASGPYVNLWLKDQILVDGLRDILNFKNSYGHLDEGGNDVVIMEYSSPNVAKPFGINHLRSTVIGEALARLFEDYGYIVVRDNHLGDWGTQFGNLLAAYEVYGEGREFDSLSMDELNEFYVRFNREKKDSSELVKKGQEFFARLEAGDNELTSKWAHAFSLSQTEFNTMYKKLGISFDTQIGEGFYVSDTKKLIDSLPQDKLKDLVEYDKASSAVVINGEHPVVLRTSDGYCVYAARDLATIDFRVKTFDPSMIGIVVGQEQASYFRSVYEVARKAGLNVRADGSETSLEQIGFGLLLDSEGKKLSTRKGTSGKLEDVINALEEKAISETRQRNPEMSDEDVKTIAEKVSIGAIVWNDLKNDRLSSIRFDIDAMLKLGGGSVIDILYSYSRTCSILKKINVNENEPLDLPSDFSSDIEHQLAVLLSELSDHIRKTVTARSPHLLASYIQELVAVHGRFYEEARVVGIEDKALFNIRVALHRSYKIVIENGLKLLNIPVTDRL